MTHSLGSSTPSSARKNPSGSSDIDMPGLKAQSVIGDKLECKCHKQGRNIAVFIDGTSYQFGDKRSNILELCARAVDDGEMQATYYRSGIGTRGKPMWRGLKYRIKRLDQKIDTMIAWNFDYIVLNAYGWLVENYRPGDCIYLFGFSRGAYQVRVIAGMIEKVGLLRRGKEEQIPLAFEIYSKVTVDADERNAAEKEMLAGMQCKAFKQTLAHEVKVHFVGVWDTVSSVGITRGPSFPLTVNGMSHVCVFRHALALDERRVKFLPEYAMGGAGPSGDGNVKEVWFAGTHADIGGGGELQEPQTFGPAFQWMLHEAREHGLRIDDYQGGWSPGPEILKDSMKTGIWPIFELWPMRHLSYNAESTTPITYSPHLGKPRLIQREQLVHYSVWLRMKQQEYSPHALLPNGVAWNVDHLNCNHLVEGDPLALFATVISKLNGCGLSALDDFDLSVLNLLAPSLRPSESASDTLFCALSAQYNSRDDRRRDSVLSALFGRMQGKFRPRLLREIFLEYGDIPAESILESIRKYGKNIVAGPYKCQHICPIEHISFTSDSKNIFTLSSKALTIWNYEKESPVSGVKKTIRRHKASSIAYSTNGVHLAMGGKNGVIQITSLETKKIVNTVKAHTNSGVGCLSRLKTSHTAKPPHIVCMAFSPNGTKLAAGEEEGAIHVWNLTPGEDVHYTKKQGHTSFIDVLVFSNDGSHLLSRSWDSVRLWNLTEGSGRCITTLLAPDELTNLSLAFVLDRFCIISVLDDENLRLRIQLMGESTAEQPEQMTAITYSGQSGYAQAFCAALSPDLRLIASGSSDNNIRVWNTFTAKMLVMYDVGEEVASIAFAPDSKSIISGTEIGTVHVWDADLL